MGIIDMRDSRPIFEQISDWYRKLILQGVMAPDEKMPSVRNLAMELSTNPNTVQRAYADLEQKGFIYTVRGRGNFVSGGQALVQQRKEEMVREIRVILDEGLSMGLDPRELALAALDTLQKSDGKGGQQ
ncbi:MAG: GntR family transcriptional regulator [Lachnospiraceae bacterium]|jgi:GntR family transcriptional regulator|nr:GntR family transcriptional regulator [Lachnospiraceae bacterium]